VIVSDKREDLVEVVWVFRPDDPSQHGKSGWLAPDVARMKVSEGLAKWPLVKPEPAVDEAPTEDEKAPAKAARK
jgi:hypothetical protein